MLDIEKIKESLKLYFEESISMNEMIKEIIMKFNEYFDDNDKGIYLVKEGLGYKLCEYDDDEKNNDFEMLDFNWYKNKEKIAVKGGSHLKDVNIRTFLLLYQPQNVLLNFRRAKGLCCSVF